MSFDCLNDCAGIVPNLNQAILTPSVAPAFFVECYAEKVRLSGFLENSFMLKFFCHICWMPKLDLTQANCCKSEIFGTLRPLQV